MTRDELEEILTEHVGGDIELLNKITILDDQASLDAVIGISTDYNVIYDYNKLVEGYMKHDGMTQEEAIEWIEYNTIRTIQCIKLQPDKIEPIILHELIS